MAAQVATGGQTAVSQSVDGRNSASGNGWVTGTRACSFSARPPYPHAQCWWLRGAGRGLPNGRKSASANTERGVRGCNTTSCHHVRVRSNGRPGVACTGRFLSIHSPKMGCVHGHERGRRDIYIDIYRKREVARSRDIRLLGVWHAGRTPRLSKCTRAQECRTPRAHPPHTSLHHHRH